jgi:hypothetical protein
MAFNSCGGSFQSHIDGSLGVRFLQGRVAQSGVISARLALKGVTGPRYFLDGVYGYFHLYGKDLSNGEAGVSSWKQVGPPETRSRSTLSCALTQEARIDSKLSAGENLSPMTSSGSTSRCRLTRISS